MEDSNNIEKYSIDRYKSNQNWRDQGVEAARSKKKVYETLIDGAIRIDICIDSCMPFTRRLRIAIEKRLKIGSAATDLQSDFEDFASPGESRSSLPSRK